MKYMVMMFGSAEGMVQQRSPEWIDGMIHFMLDLHDELTASGEIVFTAGLEDPKQARVLDASSGSVVVTDGPYAEAKESIIGYWILDVADDERILTIVRRIATQIEGPVEIRPVGQDPER